MAETVVQPGKPGSLFWRLWLRSLTVKRPQAWLAVVALGVGATVAAMLLNLYGDARRKMTEEFRAYGANVVVAPGISSNTPPKGPDLIDEAAAERLTGLSDSGKRFSAVPVLYVAARLRRVPPDPRLAEFENAVAVGADFDALRRFDPFWRIQGGTGKLSGPTSVIGAHVASRLHLKVGDALSIEPMPPSGLPRGESARQVFRIASILSTGASEDDQVFVPLAALQARSNLAGKISLIELSVPGETPEVERVVSELSRSLQGLDVRPIRQIVYSSGKVLDTIRWLLISLTALILAIIALSVMATMTAIVIERRKDIAVMKALGAGDRQVMRLFLAEGASLGLLGGLAGFILGVGLAREIIWRMFNVGLSVAWQTLPLILLGSMLLAVLATLFPVRMIRGIQPATVLKGE